MRILCNEIKDFDDGVDDELLMTIVMIKMTKMMMAVLLMLIGSENLA